MSWWSKMWNGGVGGMLARGMSRGIGQRKPRSYGGKRRRSISRPRKLRRLFKKRKYIRQKRRQAKYEIKYSKVYEATAYPTIITNAQYYSDNETICAPIIKNCWPDAGTGKQQMIGNKIYIRKLCIKMIMVNEASNHTENPIAYNLFKSNDLALTRNHKTVYTADGTTFPNLTATPLLANPHSLKQGIGKIVRAGKLRCKVGLDLETWTPQSNFSSRLKKMTIKINKPYEKNLSSVNYMTFNNPEYFLDFIQPGILVGTTNPTNPMVVGSGGLIGYSCYFTYTDI